MTQKQAILNVFKEDFQGGCYAVCCALYLNDFIDSDTYRNKHRALMASVSSQLRKFVNEKILVITPYKTGKRGGAVYVKNMDNERTSN